MKGLIYDSSCTVIQSREKKDLFYMNMKVFEVSPCPDSASDEKEEAISIWCAVYQMRTALKPNGPTA